MHVDRPVAHYDIFSPYREIDLLTGKNTTWFGHQQGEEFELLTRKDHLFMAYLHEVSLLVDHQVTEGHDAFGVGGFDFGVGGCQPFQKSLDPAHEHLGADGLGDVIIGACLKPGNLGIILSAGRQKGDQRLLKGGNLPDLLTGRDTIHLWHHQVKKNQMRLVFLGKLQTFPAIAGRKHRKSLLLQIVTDKLQNVHFVIDQQNL